jgi:putative transposase
MKANPKTHHRRSIRLKDYDYSQAGAYFVTLVTQGRVSLFGEIEKWGDEVKHPG